MTDDNKNVLSLPTNFVSRPNYDDYQELRSAVLEVLSAKSKEKGSSPRIKLYRVPSFVFIETRRIQSAIHLEIGSIYTALIDKGIELLQETPEMEAYEDIIDRIWNSGTGTLSLSSRTALSREIGSSTRPTIQPQVSNPVGEDQEIQIRILGSTLNAIVRMSEQLGIYQSSLGVLCLSLGLDYHGESIDPESSAAITKDYNDFLSKLSAKTNQLVASYEYHLEKSRQERRSKIRQVT